MKKCKLCQEWFKKYPKTEVNVLGDKVHVIGECCRSAPISCYFQNDREWCCGTVGLIRDLVYEGQELPQGIEYHFCDDQKYATIKIDDVEIDGDYIGYTLWLTWYKQRGHTDQLLILSTNGARKPTEKELIAIYQYYRKEKK